MLVTSWMIYDEGEDDAVADAAEDPVLEDEESPVAIGMSLESTGMEDVGKLELQMDW